MYEKELKKIRELYQNGLYDPEFYSQKLTSEDFLQDYESFLKIPFTHKCELRETSVEQRSNTKVKDIYGVFSSSGTTGEKTFYIYSKKDKKVHEEFVKTFYTELGITEADIGGVMAPVDTGVMAHTMMWQFTTMGTGYVNCPIPSPENIADTITKVPVTVVATRPSIATSIAYNPQIQKIAEMSHVKKLLLGGGFLSKERRKLLEKAWSADCYNMFGMSEMFGPMAGECTHKDGLHYLDSYLMIELVDPVTGIPVKEGETGVAVYTTLWEKGFPLLRYWTDDLMRIRKEVCACGSTYPRLYYLGRLNDCFSEMGHYIFPEQVEDILFHYGCIGEYKVEKNGENYIVKVETENEIREEIGKELTILFGKEVQIESAKPGDLKYDGHGKRFETGEETLWKK